MARAGAAYPQVVTRAESLLEGAIATCGARATVAGARRLMRREGARLVVVGRGAASRRDVDRARDYGLGRARVADVAWRGLPVVAAGADEVSVRRLFMDGAPMVLVRRGRRLVGVLDAATRPAARPALSLAHRLPGGAAADPTAWLLRLAGAIGSVEGRPVYAVGGVVRDLLLGRRPADVDLVVAGPVAVFARRLATALGARVCVRTGAASARIEGGRALDGSPLGRVDVAAVRNWRQAAGGGPEAMTAALAKDLAGRDFTVNAIALDLSPSGFGRAVEVPGAGRDLAERRLRPLHPLSFVEDPARVLRAARYAARLGFRLDARGRQAVRLAAGARWRPGRPGQGFATELARLAGEPDGWRALDRLLAWGAMEIWAPGYRATGVHRARLRAARDCADRARRGGRAVDPLGTMLVALLAGAPRAVAIGCLHRLGGSAGWERRLARALAAGRAMARRLDAGRPGPGADAGLLDADPLALVAAWLAGGRRARRRIAGCLAGAPDARRGGDPAARPAQGTRPRPGFEKGGAR